jgi:hypothetical protein
MATRRKKQTASQRARSKRVHASWRKRKRRKKSQFGSAERYVVSGPARWPRSFHTSKTAALDAGHACSKKFPDAICKVTYGLPGMQKTVAECNRNECWAVSGSVGRRRRRKSSR